jgi:predicted site-specific integrase-resolvase
MRNGGYLTLREVERRYKISRSAMRAWLREDGYIFPVAPRGRKVLIRDSQVRAVIARRAIHVQTLEDRYVEATDPLAMMAHVLQNRRYLLRGE